MKLSKIRDTYRTYRATIFSIDMLKKEQTCLGERDAVRVTFRMNDGGTITKKYLHLINRSSQLGKVVKEFLGTTEGGDKTNLAELIGWECYITLEKHVSVDGSEWNDITEVCQPYYLADLFVK